MRVYRVVTVLALSVLMAAAAPDIGSTLKAVESRYNSAKTLEIAFSETYAPKGRAKRTEQGILSLRKPGRMRWEYTQPAGKLFIADGKYFYLYTPSSNRVQKSKTKDSEDMHAPLAFLLGRLDFSKDFKEFLGRAEGADVWIEATPKSDQLPYTKVSFLVAPDARIKRVMVTGQDLSVLDFTFASEKRNPPMTDKLFVFTPPAGTEVVEASN